MNTYTHDKALLHLYYERLLPKDLFSKWLCYGNPNKLNRREISFTLVNDVYFRYQTFNSVEDFAQFLLKKIPIKFDVGAIYKENFELCVRDAPKIPVEKELVFDIDITDYDGIRTCCSNAVVCTKCWKFIAIACKVLDVALREDFGFDHILWVFSGRRGIHCWVADRNARILNDTQRTSIAKYFTPIKGGLSDRKRPKLTPQHSSLLREVGIIDEYFENAIVIEQDILGTNERLNNFLNMLEVDVRPHFHQAMQKCNTSVERWHAFLDVYQRLSREDETVSVFLIQEIKLYYAYPRIDVNVTRSMQHLLKAPFCVHPKTGQISVPFEAKNADSFDPSTVPTISQLIYEMNTYDEKTVEQEKDLNNIVKIKIKDYKKTSLLSYVNIFIAFLRDLQNAAIKRRLDNMEI